MMRSLYAGVSGLKTHQTKMDVIGNNIANVNTTAYKASSMTFSELMSQTTQKASGANAATGTGGVNPRQIGLGVRTGAVNTSIASQGASQSTGNPFDIMINGGAFFVVNNGSQNLFTRAGSFYVDGVGNLAMTSTGYNVMGWGVEAATGKIKQDTVSALRIMSAANMTYPPEATTRAYVSGIMDKNDTDVNTSVGKTLNLNFFDALGYNYTAKLKLKQSDSGNEYSVELDSILDASGKSLDISGVTLGQKNRTQVDESKISFDTSAYKWDEGKKQLLSLDGTLVADITKMFDGEGKLLAGNTVLDNGMTVAASLANLAKAHGYEGAEADFLNLYQTTDGGPVSVATLLGHLATSGTPAFPMMKEGSATAQMNGRFYDGTSISFDANTGKFAGVGGIATQTGTVLGLSALGGNFKDITVDFATSSMFDNKGTSTLGATSGDTNGLGSGRRLGDMIGVSIQNNGMIYASYDNGMTKLLGQIATAVFSNASGLEKQGDNLYAATLNSGAFDGIGVDVTASGGDMSTGQLEMSNVDLSAEFTEMITTQRGFQANSRIITVSDTLLEELTNLKR